MIAMMRNDAKIGPSNLLRASAEYSQYVERLDFQVSDQ